MVLALSDVPFEDDLQPGDLSFAKDEVIVVRAIAIASSPTFFHCLALTLALTAIKPRHSRCYQQHHHLQLLMLLLVVCDLGRLRRQ